MYANPLDRTNKSESFHLDPGVFMSTVSEPQNAYLDLGKERFFLLTHRAIYSLFFLEPLLFKIFINDIEVDVASNISIFDTKLSTENESHTMCNFKMI